MKPTILYKCPGRFRGPKGSSYNFKGVSKEAEFKSLLKKGWFKNLEDAADDFNGVKPKQAKKEEPKPEVQKENEENS